MRGDEDEGEASARLDEDWLVIQSLLPPGWEEAARQTGALRRERGFDGPATLLRVLLMHLVDGCSLRETAARAQAGGLAHVSDVALLNRLRGCGEWFRWLGEQISRHLSSASVEVIAGRRVRLADATVVCEPGATGSTWRLHYLIDLTTLACEQVEVTSPTEGESLARFEVQRGDVLMADRGLARRSGIRHVVDRGGDVVVRTNLNGVPLETAQGGEFRLLARLRKLEVGQAAAWPAVMRDARGTVPVRVCAIKKSAEQARQERARIGRRASRKGLETKPQTLEMAGYVVVLTTLQDVEPEAILELYRFRWQIELAFKRLKSLLQLGHLKKTDPAGAKAWLQGKLFVAALIELLIATGERFSPWGYLQPRRGPASLPMA
ncbi:MAG: IS4 family transposase [Burkholderiaceae bacterium]|nr:IS4 family transposase [Burkholderiaceae bacterium]